MVVFFLRLNKCLNACYVAINLKIVSSVLWDSRKCFQVFVRQHVTQYSTSYSMRQTALMGWVSRLSTDLNSEIQIRRNVSAAHWHRDIPFARTGSGRLSHIQMHMISVLVEWNNSNHIKIFARRMISWQICQQLQINLSARLLIKVSNALHTYYDVLQMAILFAMVKHVPVLRNLHFDCRKKIYSENYIFFVFV